MSDELQKQGNENESFDPYGFSEIEKIQREIERDLSLTWSPPTLETETEPVPASVEESTVFIPEPMSTDVPLMEVSVADIPKAPSLPAKESFYQETIKHHKSKRGRMSWRKTVAVVGVICTLGTGTLGLGIGAAIPLTQHYLLGGINNGINGDNADGTTPYGIESTRYVFGDTLATGARDGALSDVIKLVEPSVVSVSSVFNTADSNNINSSPSSGDASGIIFSEDNQKVYIATNYHVVNGASAVNISIMGSSPLSARLVGRDADADLAVISVEKKDLKIAGVHSIVIAVFGDSDEMEVGDVVLAIGNAMGEGNSATSGIISAKEKTIPIQNRNLTVLQTDAAINPGNSGGPLVNTRGEVVGINTAKLSDYYYSVEGMGFSISSNMAKPILEDLMTRGPRPFLGVQGESVSDEIAEQYDIPPIGVLIVNVIKGSGAERAGIMRTDIITSFNGNAVFSMTQLAAEVAKCKVGDTVEVKILREGTNPMILQVKLGENSPDNF